MDHKARARACIAALSERIKVLHEATSAALDALMVLYMDFDKHADDYEYGHMDASAAWQAIYQFMQFQDDLDHLERTLENVGYSVQAMSDGLYGPE